ncbi:hypothetical protein [Streptomyces sp. NBC_00306]|uniref:hypothetical protein n=1 Tax=Streptomyces sp. NBC_00306 TaxID=2975708 RepID=UPI002E27DCD4|nr:hypothetical protein [Streptomyces sp. NBC_00306]
MTTASYDEVMMSLGLEPSTSKQARCGTPSGHNRHRRGGEKPCQDCAAARAAYLRERRAAPKDPSRLPPINHGTRGGARQHWYRNEPPCDACRDAYNAACRPAKRADARRRAAARRTPGA